MKDPRIDDYIAKAAPFAKPILKKFRDLVHKTCPDVQEKWKWSFPHFDYLDGPMCSMAAFKGHCAIGFWKASLMKNAAELTDNAKSEVAMGHLGRITSLEDLPSDKKLIAFIKDAMKLNEKGIKVPQKAKGEPKALKVPDYFMSALRKNRKALSTFEKFSYSNQKEYVNWITEAKTEATRESRLGTAIEWMSEGKIRHWKYQKK